MKPERLYIERSEAVFEVKPGTEVVFLKSRATIPQKQRWETLPAQLPPGKYVLIEIGNLPD